MYRWSPPPRGLGGEKQQASSHDLLVWQGVTIPLRAPICHYMGYLLAHPECEHKAWDDYICTICADLARYRMLPLNAFEQR